MIITDLAECSDYEVVYADPAWQFNNKNTGGSMKSGAANQYDVMSVEDMGALPIPDICAKDCLLVMWWVGAMPYEALDLVKYWGFNLKNMNGFVWEKLTKNELPFFGMGYWTRAGSESAIIATRGKPKPANRGVRAVVRHPVGKHSEKPHVFREKIVQLCGEDKKRIELFSRQQVEGWDCWGNQIQPLDIAA